MLHQATMLAILALKVTVVLTLKVCQSSALLELTQRLVMLHVLSALLEMPVLKVLLLKQLALPGSFLMLELQNALDAQQASNVETQQIQQQTLLVQMENTQQDSEQLVSIAQPASNVPPSSQSLSCVRMDFTLPVVLLSAHPVKQIKNVQQ